MKKMFLVAIIAPLAACGTPAITYSPSKKSAVELRSVQTRLVGRDQDAVMRGVIATVQDLGYRITKVEPDAGTISATRETELRLAIVVRSRTAEESVVRANASIVSLREEAQVDSPEFYDRDFFIPLGATMQRELVALPNNVDPPEAVRPTAELNTAAERKAAASKAQAPSTPPRTTESNPR